MVTRGRRRSGRRQKTLLIFRQRSEITATDVWRHSSKCLCEPNPRRGQIGRCAAASSHSHWKSVPVSVLSQSHASAGHHQFVFHFFDLPQTDMKFFYKQKFLPLSAFNVLTLPVAAAAPRVYITISQ